VVQLLVICGLLFVASPASAQVICWPWGCVNCYDCWFQCDMDNFFCMIEGGYPCLQLCSCDYVFGWCSSPYCCFF
jgi:hypothetical protein